MQKHNFLWTISDSDHTEIHLEKYIYKGHFVSSLLIVGVYKCDKMSLDMTTNKMSVRSAKTQISLGICPVWSVFPVRSMGS